MNTNKVTFIGRAGVPSNKISLRRFIQVALVSSVLTTGIANAILLDHGAGDPTIRFPLWYRDTTNLPLQLCRSTQPSATDGITPYCFPLPPDPAPAFAGNIGPEAFYMNLNVDVTTGAIDLRYVTALEAAYGTVNPVGAPRLGQELVFSRVRFLMHVTVGSNCAGDYTIIHPYGTDQFTDVPEGNRALFSTSDKPLGLIGNFDGALDGDVGPFLQWDDGAGNPLNTTALRAASAPSLVAPNGDEFIGDPNTLHTFTGSRQISLDPADPPLTPQNFVEVRYDGPNTVGTNPTDCNLDGAGNNFFRVSSGALMGQVYTAPILTPTRATSAVYSRDAAGNTTVDVYATTDPGNTLIVVGNNGMPNVQMTEDLTGGVPGAGNRFYHSHLEFAGPPPSSVTVMNLTSNPIATSEIQVVDLVKVTKSDFDPVTNKLCINAHSSDHTPDGGAPALILDGPQGGPLSATDCDGAFGPKLDASDLSYQVTVPKDIAASDWITAQIRVSSSFGGLATDDVNTLTGAPDNVGVSPATANDTFNNISDVVATANLNVGGNDNPPNLTPIILSQPAKGTVTGQAGGNVTFTPSANTSIADSPLTFTYVVKNGLNVSNIATGTLNIGTDTNQPPITTADNFVVQRRTSNVPNNVGNTLFKASILSNDKAAKNTAFNLGSVVVSASAAGPYGASANIAGNAGGVVTANGDGTVTFVPTLGAVGGTVSSFYYKVSSDAGVQTPAGTKVDVSVPVGAENITLSPQSKYQNGNWTIRITDAVAGWTGNGGVPGITLTPSISCYVVRNVTTNTNFTPAGQYIGKVGLPAGGVIDLTAVAGTVSDNGTTTVPTVKINDQVLVQCASTNRPQVPAGVPFPSLTNAISTPTVNIIAK